MDLQHNLNEIYPDLNMDCFVDYVIEVNRVMNDIHLSINHEYRMNIDQFMILLFIEMSKNGCRTLKDIKDQFGWDLVKINKSIKALVKLNYLDKEDQIQMNELY